MSDFELRDAVRERVPVFVGLFGASGSGKTMSALRIATGIQRVTGGDIAVIDTESRRATHFADQFKFKHLAFPAPFSPSRYVEAIELCVKRGCTTVIVDSMSHEHEGPGGVLEMHDKEMGGDYKKSMQAWIKPKGERRRLINTILQLPINAVFCFRAKEKIKPGKNRGDTPVDLGWMPIAGEEFLFEMTLNALLEPGSKGSPTWAPEQPASRSMIKLPLQFEQRMLDKRGSLTEDDGEFFARWAAGDASAPAKPAEPYRFPKGEFVGKTFADLADEDLTRLRAASRDGNPLIKLVDAEMALRSARDQGGATDGEPYDGPTDGSEPGATA